MFNLLGRPKGVSALAAASTVAIVAALASPALAQEQQRNFNIAAQPLSSALLEFSQQADIPVGVAPALLNGKQAPAVVGSFTPSDALNRLLAGSGLTASQRGEGGYVLADSASPTRLGDASGAAPSDDSNGATEEILVVGSRTLNADIRRTEDAAQPYVVFNRDDIAQSGASNVEEFLSRRLSASTSPPPASQTDHRGFTTSEISLRGLGSDETLILIDGRRAAGFLGNSNEIRQADINGIPLSAIERIEVLPTTASGIYGGSATGGVINIILRRDYSGTEVQATYGNTFDTDVSNSRVDLSMGRNFNGGKTNVMVSGSFANANSLTTGDRAFEARRRSTILQNNPSSLVPGFIPPLGATTNIMSADGSNLTLLGSNTPLNSAITFVPYGYGGVSTDGGAAFVTNAGNYNLDLAHTAQFEGARQTILNASHLSSLDISVRQEITPWLSMYLDASASQNAGRALDNGAFSTYFVAAGDPANPFNQDILATAPALGADSTAKTTLDSYRAVAGAIIDLPASWRAAIDYTWNETRFTTRGAAGLDDASAGAAVSDGSLNIFRDTNIFGGSFAPFALQSGQSLGPVDTRLTDAAARLSGPIPPSLPGGAITLSILAEERHENIGDVRSFLPLDATSALRALTPERSQTVRSLYGELLFPFVSQQNRFPGVELLDLQVAARHDQYDTSAAGTVRLNASGTPITPISRTESSFSSTDPTIGLRYKPIEDLMLRVSYGTGFLPPGLHQLVQNPTTQPNLGALGFKDPLRGNETIALPTGRPFVTGGGNPNLRPEQSESWSAGVILTPTLIPGLRISADWTRINKSDAITTLGITQANLNLLAQFAPDRFTRAAVAPGDPFSVGRITAIDLTMINFASARIEAVDYGLDYSLPTHDFGELSFHIDATNMRHNLTAISPLASMVEHAGAVSDIHWRANASITWDVNQWRLAWTTRYFDSACTEVGCPLNPDSNSVSIPSQTYNDLFVRYRFGDDAARGALANVELQFGVNNIFNVAPPFDPIGLYSQFGDPRLANYYLSLRKAF